jgi:2'-deoxynucleoside 5'-phosphate N-hydrolase
MKVAIVGGKYDESQIKIYKEIKKILEDQGINVDFSYFSTSVDQDDSNLEQTYQRNLKLIKNSDILIADTTIYSSGIGYLIASSLNLKKPVLALFDSESGKKSSNIIKSSARSKLLTFKEYTNKELIDVINNFIRSAKNILDTKFILIISPEIDRYLEWASAQKRMHKAQIVREAVEEMMKKDKDWKKNQD